MQSLKSDELTAPSAHAVQFVDASWPEKNPMVQFWHAATALPEFGSNFPWEHELHTCVLLLSANFPAGHIWHSAKPAAEKNPAWQS